MGKQTESVAAGAVQLDLTVELGRTTLTIDRLMECTEGSLIELPGSVVGQGGRYIADVLANGAPAARGEIVVIGEHLGVRVTETVSR